jgi:CBS-domain-containing membrane protein
MSDEETRTGCALGVRSRETFRGDAGPSLEFGVLCPVSGLDVPLDECVRCKDSRGLRLGASMHETFVVCDANVDELDGTLPGATESNPRPDAASADESTIASIMTTKVICVGPELSVAALGALFLDRGISGAPVVDESGRAIGMVSKTDLVRHHHEQRMAADEHREQFVADIMMPMAFCLPANESVTKAAALMAFEGMHRVPVVNTHRQIVGLVSPLDVMRWMARRHGYVLGPGPRESTT